MANAQEIKTLASNRQEQDIIEASRVSPSKSPTGTTQARESVIKSHLSSPIDRRSPLRRFLAASFYAFVLFCMHSVWTVFIVTKFTYIYCRSRINAILFYHHHAPQLIRRDVSHLKRLPEHLSVILVLETEGGIEGLMESVAELACWCTAAGVPLLSIYEQTGVLKKYREASHRITSMRLQQYFGKSRPALRIRSPHREAFVNGDMEDMASGQSDHGLPRTQPGMGNIEFEPDTLELLFISEEDGRESMVDLTKTFCHMVQSGTLKVDDVSIDLIDEEVRELVMPEPDLLIVFGQGWKDGMKLRGYPPWPIRLTEVFHVPGNDGVNYQGFLRGLHKYGKAEMRLGR